MNDNPLSAFPVPTPFASAGMTIREYAAIAAMTGLLAAGHDRSTRAVTRLAAEHADALLAELDERKP